MEEWRFFACLMNVSLAFRKALLELKRIINSDKRNTVSCAMSYERKFSPFQADYYTNSLTIELSNKLCKIFVPCLQLMEKQKEQQQQKLAY